METGGTGKERASGGGIVIFQNFGENLRAADATAMTLIAARSFENGAPPVPPAPAAGIIGPYRFDRLNCP